MRLIRLSDEDANWLEECHRELAADYQYGAKLEKDPEMKVDLMRRVTRHTRLAYAFGHGRKVDELSSVYWTNGGET